MVQPVVDVDQVERLIGERQSLDVRDDRRDREAKPARAFPRSTCRFKGDVRRDDRTSSARQKLRVHARTAAHIQDARSADDVSVSRRRFSRNFSPMSHS